MKFPDLLKKIREKSTSSEFQDIVENIKMLNEDQRNILVSSINILYNTRNSICISGPAGSGKTFLTKTLLKILESLYDSSKIALAAPTHQAKRVLAESSNRDAYTVHSLFRILPNLEEDKISFEPTGKEPPKLQDILFLVIDEVSMIDENLFHIIYSKLPMNTRIIALGDPYQLAPVKSDKISLFFTHRDFTQFRLSKIMRQKDGSSIIDQANKIRKKEISSLFNEGNVIKCNSNSDFIRKYLDIVKNPEDALKNRIVAYTNYVVDCFNEVIRKNVYNTNEQFVIGELLVLQQALIQNDTTIFSNGEIVKVLDIQEKYQNFYFNYSNDSCNVKYYKLKVLSLDTDEINFINIIDSNDTDFSFKMHVEASRLKDVKRKERFAKLGLYWKDWWENKNFFIEVKPIFASTVHKSQGISVNNCFVYQQDFDKSSSDENYYQLLYVAVTRAKQNVYFI